MDKIRLILANTSQITTHADEIIGDIPQYYADGYRRIKKAEEAAQKLAAGYLLKKYLGVFNDSQITRTEYGKPMLRSGKTFFNLAHSGEYVVLAMADVNIGVDIEKITDIHWLSARKVFSIEQLEKLERVPVKEQQQEFTRLWTECEAGLKLLGMGFSATQPGKYNCTEDRKIYCFQHEKYMIACASYEEMEITISIE